MTVWGWQQGAIAANVFFLYSTRRMRALSVPSLPAGVCVGLFLL